MTNFLIVECTHGVFEIQSRETGETVGSMTRMHTGEYVVTSQDVQCVTNTWDDAVAFAEKFI